MIELQQLGKTFYTRNGPVEAVREISLKICEMCIRDRHYQRRPLFHGNQSISSRRGASSHQYNPFIALCEHTATETAGEVYGFNFVYSGNFLDEVEVDQLCGTRVQIGLGSENFRWLLEPGERFVTPEAVMTYSAAGIGQMSRNFHRFIRGHILPPEPYEKRPVVLNTWEACLFSINEEELLRFADAAAECGMDMVVMDDGWFGARNLSLIHILKVAALKRDRGAAEIPIIRRVGQQLFISCLLYTSNLKFLPTRRGLI